MAKFALVAPVPPPRAPAGPRGPQAASPQIGIYQQPFFGGGYILGIYWYIPYQVYTKTIYLHTIIITGDGEP